VLDELFGANQTEKCAIGRVRGQNGHPSSLVRQLISYNGYLPAAKIVRKLTRDGFRDRHRDASPNPIYETKCRHNGCSC
jgi:hypothetical protein